MRVVGTDLSTTKATKQPTFVFNDSPEKQDEDSESSDDRAARLSVPSDFDEDENERRPSDFRTRSDISFESEPLKSDEHEGSVIGGGSALRGFNRMRTISA